MKNTTQLEEVASSGSDLAILDMTVNDDGQVLLLGIGRRVWPNRNARFLKRANHLLGCIAHSVTKPKLNHANTQIKLSSGA